MAFDNCDQSQQSPRAVMTAKLTGPRASSTVRNIRKRRGVRECIFRWNSPGANKVIAFERLPLGAIKPLWLDQSATAARSRSRLCRLPQSTHPSRRARSLHAPHRIIRTAGGVVGCRDARQLAVGLRADGASGRSPAHIGACANCWLISRARKTPMVIWASTRPLHVTITATAKTANCGRRAARCWRCWPTTNSAAMGAILKRCDVRL